MNDGGLTLAPVSGTRQRRQDLFWLIWAAAAAFGCYFCMYAFRKPFTASSYSDTTLGGIGFKTVLVTSQVMGYMVSKFIGIKIIAEMPPHRRATGIAVLVVCAELALVLFGLIPRPWNALCLFANGLPLGMIFGLILGMLEGRRMTEALTAGLCASFILADGVTKSVGAWLLKQGVTEDWMPCVAGALFLIPLGVCVVMLSRIPPPNVQDVAARAERTPMNRDQRRSFVRRYALGLIPLSLMYLLVTVVRSIRADYAPEIWRGLGSPAEPAVFAQSELLVVFGVLAVNGSAVLIKDNRRAFFISLATCAGGFCLLLAALLARRNHLLGDFGFMVAVGLGLYLPYVAMHTTVFERMLAMTRERGNIGFLMYVVDSVGYLGYVAVMVAHNFGPKAHDLVGLLTSACWVSIGLSAGCLVMSWVYFSAITSAPIASHVVEPAEGLA
ncbi:MAG: hypothetical protein JWP89_6590 [Schlesneria sp.]|nr:hypothetical protein [Schlesneria sp.]